MGLLGNIFNKAAQEEQRSKLDYENAKGYRKRRLALFRQAAMKELSKKLPDAAFLLNMRFPSFVAYSASKRALMVGTFADLVFPNLEFVSDYDVGPSATRERIAAINKFEKLVLAFDQMVSDSHNLDLGELADEDGAEDYVRFIVKHGYYVLKLVPAEMIIRGMIVKNGDCLGYSDWWSAEDDGFFHDIIRHDIADRGKTLDKISEVDVRIDFLSGSRRNYFIYRFIYDEMNKYSIAELREEFAAEMSALKEFFNKIEHDLRTMPAELCDALNNEQTEELRQRFTDLHWRNDEAKAYMGRLS